MEDQREPIRMVREDSVAANHTSAWLGAGIVALIIVLGLSVGYIYQQQSNSKQVASQNADMSASISQMESQIETLRSQVNQPPAVQPAPSAASSQPGTASVASRHRRPPKTSV